MLASTSLILFTARHPRAAVDQLEAVKRRNESYGGAFGFSQIRPRKST
jgi:hypothetical protein